MRAAAFLLAAVCASAHVVSMSSGDLAVDGAHAHFELRMPAYELVHVQSPERTLLDHIRFSGGGGDARRVAQACAADRARDTYLCTAEYEFPAPPTAIEVECTLARATVPNHVHLLRATMGGKHDQGIFDLSFTRTTLRFRPPTAAEVAAGEAFAGAARALGGAVQLLFLAALVLAARGKRELAALAAMFVLGEAAAVLLGPRTAWQPAPRFVEAAAALTVAYLAVEILLLPKAGARWIVAGALGLFHGLYLYLFVRTSGYRPGWVLAGAAGAGLAAIAILALVFSRLGRPMRALRPVQVSASALFVFGVVWFFLRLRS